MSAVLATRLDQSTGTTAPTGTPIAQVKPMNNVLHHVTATKSLLRFMSCGAVDDGKSTLLGRLLYDTGSVPDDRLRALEADSKRYGTRQGQLDFALLIDGLAAEREQGITIDVAYRFFGTKTRQFIVADTPGHVQYTRNTVTAASTTQAAVLLVDATKGITEQTRRHAYMLNLLGVRHLVVTINKMDLVPDAAARYQQLQSEIDVLRQNMALESLHIIPVAAVLGYNVVHGAPAWPWYTGKTLLQTLETLPESSTVALPWRLAVQRVCRPNDTFRGFAGTLTGSTLRVGDAVQVWPSGRTSHVTRIVTYNGDQPHAQAGEAITVVLADNIDISRGCVLANPDHAPQRSTHITADVIGVHDNALQLNQRLLLKLGTATVTGYLERIESVTDMATYQPVAASQVSLNDVARTQWRLETPLVCESYDQNPTLGSFIVIDPSSGATLAAGMVRDAAAEGKATATTSTVEKKGERNWRSFLKAVSWRITGSIDTMLVSYFVTGDIKLAASIGAAEVLTKIFLYYGHERVWNLIPYGRR